MIIWHQPDKKPEKDGRYFADVKIGEDERLEYCFYSTLGNVWTVNGEIVLPILWAEEVTDNEEV